MKPIVCIFFDIDGTLVDTHGVGKNAFQRTIRELLGVDDDLAGVSFAGSTDLNLFRQICLRNGRASTSELEQAFFDLLPVHLSHPEVLAGISLLPGVNELLSALAARPGVMLGLLTGNVERCARLKLAPHHLNDYFPFGAYGDEFAARNDIAFRARERAVERAGPRPLVFRVVGDTPLDIAAARAIAAPCLAVATGKYRAEDLRAVGAALAVESLADASRLTDWLLME